MKNSFFLCLTLLLASAAERCDAAIVTVTASGTAYSIHDALLTDAKAGGFVEVGDKFTVEYTIDTSLLTSLFPISGEPAFSTDAITSVSLAHARRESPGVFASSVTEFDSTNFGTNTNNNSVRITDELVSLGASVQSRAHVFSENYFYNRVFVQLTGLNLDPNTTDIASTIVNGVNGAGVIPFVEITTTHKDSNTNATILLNNVTTSSFITAVPEPSSCAVLGCICAVATLRRKRRQGQ
ncbi:hypothetical protein [Planctomycetes bacterium K23_9]|uniref:PEP-CTERM protein-sorting domain-containing protein n=1 Tax=Stieleria marina TaxID=1930275 RepID=A0A517NZ24_9BACT|nr:hypothetical protein K239x_43620 [Planctomycetes bacterium K23_9]